MSEIIKAKNIHKSFTNNKGKKLDVLKDISLDIENNKISVIVGASGSGKSTLLHILSGLDKPDSGKISFDNIETIKLSDDELSKFRNKNIGFVFQFHHLLPELTAVENIAIPQMISNIDQKSAEKKATELLQLVGLEERDSHKPAELSGGEQQRIAIARALINEPKIIFADEPTGNLDTHNSKIVHNLFLKLKKDFNMTFLIVTHNPELVKLADIVYEMKDGKISRKEK